MTERQISDVVRNKAILDQLNHLEINTLEELCSYSPKRLTEKGVASLYVKDITIALQCEGLDLSKK